MGRDEVEIAVVKEGRSGILGLGAEPAVVRVSLVKPQPEDNTGEVAREVLERLLSLMEVPGTVTLQTVPADGGTFSIVVNITGDDLGILIGRRGQTLASLQYIVRLILSYRLKKRVPVVIDVEGYKQRRYRALEDFARQMAEQVKGRGKPFTFEPMSAFERRIIHMALANRPDVTTESVGEGEERKVVISPRRP